MNKELLMKLFNYSPEAGNGAGTGGTGEAGSAGSDNPQSEIGADQESEFKGPQSQSELDSLINKSTQKALDNYKRGEADRIRTAIAEALSKEKDYSKLSQEERAQKEFDDQKTQFEQERAQFEQEKLVVQVEKDLIAKGLPSDFAEILSTGDAESALENVKKFEIAFNKAVAEEVKKSVRQTDPSLGSNGAQATSNYGAEVAKSTGAATRTKPF